MTRAARPEAGDDALRLGDDALRLGDDARRFGSAGQIACPIVHP
jgi:hypothetical protein